MTKTKRQLRAEAVDRLRGYVPEHDDGLSSCLGLFDCMTYGYGVDEPWTVMRDALIDLLTDDAGRVGNHLLDATKRTNLDWLFASSEQFRQAVSAFAFAHANECPTSPTQMVDWLMAPHVDANDAFSPESDVIAGDVDANDENATCNNSGDFVTHDSREKLEADVRSFVYDNGWFDFEWQDEEPDLDSRPTVFRLFTEWLDRQAAITSRDWCWEYDQLDDEANRLRAKIDELQASNDELRKRFSEIAELNGSAWQDGFEKGCESRDDAIADWRAETNRLHEELAKRDKGIARLKRQRDEARQELKKYRWEYCETCEHAELVDRLEAERDKLKSYVEDPTADYAKLVKERDELKRKLDIAKRHEERADEECNECRAHFDELLGELRAERDALAHDLRDCNAQRERLRQALGIAIDHAHEIMTLVNLDGEVIG